MPRRYVIYIYIYIYMQRRKIKDIIIELRTFLDISRKFENNENLSF